MSCDQHEILQLLREEADWYERNSPNYMKVNLLRHAADLISSLSWERNRWKEAADASNAANEEQGEELERLRHPEREVALQRIKGWTDFHPETYCHRCGHRNIDSWHVESSLWNVVDPSGAMILCPSCFASLYHEKTGLNPHWVLSVEQA